MRVVAGELRGRRLASASGRSSRPTSERARAGLFDWLGARVEDARVLDLFAGSGALGIEALSRGARSCVFVERSQRVAATLRRNLAALGLGDVARTIHRDVAPLLRGRDLAGEPFDLVLADPPYGDGWAERLVNADGLVRRLAPQGLLIAEVSRRETSATPRTQLELLERRSYGETAFDVYWLVAESARA